MKPFHKMKKKPLHAEDVAEELRKRVQFGRLTFRESEVLRIADILEKLSYRCAEAYQGSARSLTQRATTRTGPW